jgi:hypothetical protein
VPLDDASVWLVRTYRWLAAAHVIEYHVADHGKRLQPGWAAALAATPLATTVARLLSPGTCDRTLPGPVWPLSLQAFAALCQQCALDRHPPPSVPTAPLDPLLVSGLSVKKRHEVARLLPLLGRVAAATGARLVVDVGGGVGHLARAVAYTLGLDVLVWDGDADHVAGARARDAQCRRLLAHRAQRGDAAAAALLQGAGTVRHVHWRLPTTLDGHGFALAVADALGTAPPPPPLVLVGLHTCGDLGPTLLRCYLEAACVRAVVSLGCCYMHLSEAEGLALRAAAAEAGAGQGYPLSRRYAHVALGDTLRELACHALDAYQVPRRSCVCVCVCVCLGTLFSCVYWARAGTGGGGARHTACAWPAGGS